MEFTLPSDMIATGLQMLFFVLLLFFALHSAFLGYHWSHYGSSKKITTIGLGVYLSGGAIILLIYAASLASV